MSTLEELKKAADEAELNLARELRRRPFTGGDYFTAAALVEIQRGAETLLRHISQVSALGFADLVRDNDPSPVDGMPLEEEIPF